MSNICFSQFILNDLERQLTQSDPDEMIELYKDRLVNGFSDILKTEMKFEFIKETHQNITLARSTVAILSVEEYLRLKEIEKMAENLWKVEKND